MNTGRNDHNEDTGVKLMELDIRHLSDSQFAKLGTPHIAYVKPVTVNGGAAFSIHGADGQPIGMAPGLELAVAAANQHEMLALRVH